MENQNFAENDAENQAVEAVHTADIVGVPQDDVQGQPAPEKGLDSLQVGMSLTFPDTSVTLAQYREIVSGVTVPIDIDLNAAVDIAVDGQKLGEGALVQIGEKIGLQITSWSHRET